MEFTLNLKKYMLAILTSNEVDLLKISIESAIHQTHKDYDLYIVVNSTNPDYLSKVKALCAGYIGSVIKDIVETESNGKPGKGHNSVLNLFNTLPYEYLIMCDGDDFLYPCAVSRLNKLIEERKPDIIGLMGNCSRITVDQYKSTEQKYENGNHTKHHFIYSNNLMIERNRGINHIKGYYNKMLANPMRLMVTNKKIISKYEQLYDERMNVYDDFITFVRVVDESVNHGLNVLFLNDDNIYLYNHTNIKSVSKFFENDGNQYKIIEDQKTYEKYDLSDYDVTKIKIFPNIYVNQYEKQLIHKFHQVITNKFNQHAVTHLGFEKRYLSLKNILFVDTGTDWTHDTINNRSLRGTENAIYQISNTLSKHGNNIEVFTRRNINHSVTSKLKYVDLNHIISSNCKPDIIVFQGSPLMEYNFFNSKNSENTKCYIWIQHDVTVNFVKNQYSKLEEIDKHIKGYIFVSHWQKNRFIQYYKLNANKCHVMRNAVSPTMSLLPKIPKTRTLIYISSPYRGMINLYPLFNELLKVIPDITLKIFSAFDLENNNNLGTYSPLTVKDLEEKCQGNDAYYKEHYKLLASHDKIHFYGNVPQNILFQHLKASMIFLYPNTFPETCCTSILEAMEARCNIITSDLGALRETSNNFGDYYDPCIDVNHFDYSPEKAMIEPFNVNQLSKNYVKDILSCTIDKFRNYNSAENQKLLDLQEKYILENCQWNNRLNDFYDVINSD